MWVRWTASLVALSGAGVLAGAQAPGGETPLRLADALRRADAHAYANRAVLGVRDAQSAATTATLRAILPTARFEAGAARTTDPIGAFGTTLRQRTITQQDFAPARLNNPAGITNYSGGIVFEQPLFNADAWIARRGAADATRGANANVEWTNRTTRLDVIRAYYGAILAEEKAATLTVALRAAREHVRRADAMTQNGLVTPSDALLASVRAGDVEAALVEAQGIAHTARLTLATAIGQPRDTVLSLPERLPTADAVRRLATETRFTESLGARADVGMAKYALRAAEADVDRARSLALPRLNGFARYDWNSALRPFGGEGSWTVGVMGTWTPFAGASEIAEVRASQGRRAAARAAHDGSEAKARLDLAQTATALDVAAARLEIAERAVRQSADAHRIVARRYDAGLAPIVELLDAAAIDRQAQLGFASARYDLIVATADRRRAVGGDPGAVASLEVAGSAATLPPND